MKASDDVYLEGFKLALENAKRLFNAAEILESKREFAIANSLLILSSEEGIKSISILNRWIFPESGAVDFNLMFQDHKHKINILRSLIVFARMGRMMMELFYFPVYHALKNNSADASKVRSDSFEKLLEWFRIEAKGKQTDLSIENKWWISAKAEKENGLYVGFNARDRKWHSPTSVTRKRYMKSKRYVQAFLTDLIAMEAIDFKSEVFTSLYNIVKPIIREYSDQRETS